MTDRKLSLNDVETLSRDALTGAGASEVQARSLARAVAAAEGDGIRSHGLTYVPVYCQHLECGKVIGDAVPVADRVAASSIAVDAHSGFAHAAIDAGFEQLIPAARENGCAGLSVRNSYNCCVLGYHVEQLATHGLVGLGFTNAPASIAPVGGKKPVIGTNPFALATPNGTGGAAFVIDQSASVVAKSEIILRSKSGEPIPEGWALDADGRPATDPDAALEGSMMPSGGYKGFGMGLMVEVFAAAISGATLGIHASPFSGTVGGPPKTGQFFLAIDPVRFSGGAFAERLDELIGAIVIQEGARLPGSRRLANRARIAADDGVLVNADLIGRIRAYVRD